MIIVTRHLSDDRNKWDSSVWPVFPVFEALVQLPQQRCPSITPV